ncbi:MAG: transcription-repair coupling factor [Ruminococcaceae bacterium]|nr:transcription-repair coupling factor [Oscillospiraceae bacterium]
MSCFAKIMQNNEEYKKLTVALDKNRVPMGALGLSHINKAHLMHTLCADGRKCIAVTPDEASARRLTEDLVSMGSRAYIFPARDFSFSTTEGQSREYEHVRIGALTKIINNDFDVVACSIEAFLQFTMPPEELLDRTFRLVSGEDYSLDEAVSTLIKAGYVRSPQVDGSGQFAVRGGILDLFPPDRENPIRIEFWGDTVDSISSFEAESQRRTDMLEEIEITPATEIIFDSLDELKNKISEFMLTVKGKGSQKAKASLQADIEKLSNDVRVSSLDRYLSLAYSSLATIFDYCTKDTVLCVCESAGVKERGEASIKLLHEEITACVEEGTLCKGLDKFGLLWSEVLGVFGRNKTLYLDNLPRGSFDTPVKELINFTSLQLNLWNGTLNVLLDDISYFKNKKDRTCVVMAGTDKAAKALCDDLEKEGYNVVFFDKMPKEFPKGYVSVIEGALSAGMEYPQDKFRLISYGRRTAPKKLKKHKNYKASNAFHSLEEMHKGDYIVHSMHGIGIFEGITQLEASGATKDYIKIRYDKGDILYIPVTQLDHVAKYIGPRSETNSVKLNKLGSDKWLKTKNRVKSAVKDMADDLIQLYSKRLNIKGFAFSPDIDMQSDFERRFEFDETDDQLRCIDEIKNDMEKPYPMDRLLCGDVGFGKTEVALRGVFKCIADGKQCAILVPTTILALQHYQTIQKRFEGFPVESAMLSRFCTAKEQAEIVKNLKRGSIDIVVGTHKLLSKKLEFKDLGLVIVDEEQRFGVAQKEKLKERFPNVDVLTLSATPIPRTLNMAMTGIRDMSIIEEAPQDRHPVQTYVIEHNMEVLVQAMEKELRRGGQVYYLYNKVESIDRKAAEIKEMLPDARVAVGHGKMSEEELSDVWKSLIEGETDILVCTTIIETGVDVPNANTLIIEDADRMGLAQLHQIRGRVGRSARRASAYFTFTRGKQLSEIADRRLSAIREFTEFGSGFKIAMRDLELRGAGNVLGAQQHGHMEAVGYDMYLKLLAEAVGEEKGEEVKDTSKDCLIDLHIDANIPKKYIENVPHRLAMYRRIADIRSQEDADDVIDELIDRFGEPPQSVMGLIDIALLRAAAVENNITEIGQTKDRLLIYSDVLDMKKIAALSNAMRGRISVATVPRPHFKVKLIDGQSQTDALKQTMALMLLADKKEEEN